MNLSFCPFVLIVHINSWRSLELLNFAFKTHKIALELQNDAAAPEKDFSTSEKNGFIGGYSALEVYYRESVWMSWWVWGLFMGVVGFSSFALILQSVFGIPVGTRPAPNYLLLILILTLVLIFANFRKLSITVDAQKIEVNYGTIKRIISWNDVVSCEPTRAKFAVYGGVGIRLGIDKSLAFTTLLGNAVKIATRNGLPFVFSTNNPEKLSKLINEYSTSERII